MDACVATVARLGKCVCACRAATPANEVWLSKPGGVLRDGTCAVAGMAEVSGVCERCNFLIVYE
jgi:hypothetical protein